MELAIEGRNAVVTGASKGIGLAIAKTLAREKVNLAIIARNAELINREGDEISRTHGVQVIPIVADLSTMNGIKFATEKAVSNLGEIDILINNAGAIPAGSINVVDDRTVNESWDLKLHGYIRMAREFLPSMRYRKWGRIVNITGMAGIQPSAGYIFGGPANAALMNFTKGLALEVAKDGVLINAVNPGPIQTDRYEEMTATRADQAGFSIEKQLSLQVKEVPLGRIGRPEEVADITAFLCSERCTYISGAVVPVSGGVGAVL